jgi:flagellar hook-associated protein 1 FlgK
VLSSFFSSLQTSAAAPDNIASRQLLLTSAQTLSNRFNAISSQLTQQNQGINGQLDTLTGQVNQLTSSIASLNQQIALTTTSGSGPANLLDARNEAVRTLNELVGVTVNEREGNYDVSLGSGQMLVLGGTSNTLSVSPGPIDKGEYNIQVNYAQSSSDVTSVITGGKIGGLLRYRTDVLAPAMNDLGRTALVVAGAVNSQLGQGLDANGEFGASLFSNINSAGAISQRSLAASSNDAASGNLNVTISDTSALTTYDYKVTFDVNKQYSVSRSDGKNMGGPFDLSTTPPPVFDGFTLALNGGGAPKEGDTFKIVPTRSGATTISTQLTDATKLAFAGPLSATGNTGNEGTGTIAQPSLSSALDIYGGTGLAELQGAIEHSMPVKLAFDAASGGTQVYNVYDAKGTKIGSGSIVPGQSNKLTISVPMRDAAGNPILDAASNPKTFSFETTIGGSPAKNDNYTFSFNAEGKSDNRNANELLGLQTKATVGITAGNAGVSMTTAYSRLVEQVGAQASQAGVDSTATGAILTQAKASQNSVSQVNLDDEAADLVKFQQYYTASTQIIKAAQETFSTLINSL